VFPFLSVMLLFFSIPVYIDYAVYDVCRLRPPYSVFLMKLMLLCVS
jgi:hypothetical protein